MAYGDPNFELDFSGGVNLDASPYLLQENQAADLRNIQGTPQGRLDKRNGTELFATFPTLLSSCHTLFAHEVGTPGFLVVGRDANDNDHDAIIELAGDGTSQLLTNGFAPGRPWEFVQGSPGNPAAVGSSPPDTDQGPIYGMNGYDTPQYWDGTSSQTEDWVAWAGTVPSSTPFLIYALDRFWAAGDPANPGRVWGTGLSQGATPLPDPCNWDSDQIDDVDPDDGQVITGLGKVGPYVLVFKDRKTYVVSDPVVRAYRRVSSNIGCCAHRSIVETEQGTMFLSEDVGVCVTDGSSIRVISQNIDPLLRRIAHTYPDSLKQAAGAYHHDSYWLSVPESGTMNTLTLEYNLETSSWWIHTSCSQDYTVGLAGGNYQRLFVACPSQGRVGVAYADNVWTDYGLPYRSFWQSANRIWGAAHMNKRVNQLRMDGLGVWQVKARTSFVNDFELLDDVVWEPDPNPSSELFGGAGNFGEDGTFGPQAGINYRRFYTPAEGWGRAWSFLIQDSDEGIATQFSIFSATTFARGRAD